MKELGELLGLVGDPRYSKYAVEFLIVGIPKDIKEYFSKITNRETINNRLYELPQIFRMEPQESLELIERGFLKLGYQFKGDKDKILERISWVTGRIPVV